MTHSLGPIVDPPRLTVLLVADNGSVTGRTAVWTQIARHEAITSLARATFADGGAIAIPLDIEVAPLVATVALEYADPPAAEVRGAPPPTPRVTVVETEARTQSARSFFAPLAVRNAVRFLDAAGDPVPLRTSTDTDLAGLSDFVRQRVTPRMLELTQPAFAVLISPGRHLMEEVAVLREASVPTFMFETDTAADDGAAALFVKSGVHDPTARLLEGTTRSPWTEEVEESLYPGDRPPGLPYAYLMQRLVAERRG